MTCSSEKSWQKKLRSLKKILINMHLYKQTCRPCSLIEVIKNHWIGKLMPNLLTQVIPNWFKCMRRVGKWAQDHILSVFICKWTRIISQRESISTLWDNVAQECTYIDLYSYTNSNFMSNTAHIDFSVN